MRPRARVREPDSPGAPLLSRTVIPLSANSPDARSAREDCDQRPAGPVAAQGAAQAQTEAPRGSAPTAARCMRRPPRSPRTEHPAGQERRRSFRGRHSWPGPAMCHPRGVGRCLCPVPDLLTHRPSTRSGPQPPRQWGTVPHSASCTCTRWMITSIRSLTVAFGEISRELSG